MGRALGSSVGSQHLAPVESCKGKEPPLATCSQGEAGEEGAGAVTGQ